jgi:superfamily I DNA/RNA helicase
MISRAKCDGFDVQDYYSFVQDQIQTNKTRNPTRLMQIAEIYSLYQKNLRCNNKVDFDDLLLLMLKLLQTNSKVCDTIGSRFLAVLVDEWQDSNTLQYRLIQLIVEAIHNVAASKAKNTKDTQAATLRQCDAIQPSAFVVGDPGTASIYTIRITGAMLDNCVGLYACKLFSNKSYTCYNSSMHSLCAQTSPHFTAHTVCYNTLHADQSIYGFRGARGGNIDQFRQDFQNCTVTQLSVNYRCTDKIAAAATAIIQKVKNIDSKPITTVRTANCDVKIANYPDEQHQGTAIVQIIAERRITDKAQLKDIAILYRAHKHAYAIETAFLLAGISFTNAKAINFYARG